MYSWKEFAKLPNIKNLDLREQWQKYYTYQFYEASTTSPSSAASAAAGAGGGKLVKRTRGKSAFFIDDYNANWEFFIADDSGKKTDRVDTGIDAGNYYINDSYSIEGKGYVVVFTNESDHKFQYIDAAGRIVRTDTLTGFQGYDTLVGRFFAVIQNTAGDGSKTITYFDGEKVYDTTFGGDGYTSTVVVHNHTNFYNYEGNSWGDDEASFHENTSAVGPIVYDNLDGDTTYSWYCLNKGVKVLIQSEAVNHSYDYEFDFNNGFVFAIDFNQDNGVYDGFRIVDLATGGTLHSMDISSDNYYSYDSTFYGTGKFAAIFYDGDTNNYDIYTYDYATNVMNNYTHAQTNYYYDFFCTQRTPITGFDYDAYNYYYRSFISEDIVFIFKSPSYNSNYFEYFNACDLLYIPSGVYDETQSENLVNLDGKGIKAYVGMFTENVFTMFVDATGTWGAQGNAGQLTVTSTGYGYSNFGFGATSWDNFDYRQLYDAYVWKFFFSGVEDKIFLRDTNGDAVVSESLTPNNNFENERGLFVVHNEDDSRTRYWNPLIGTASPTAFVELSGPDSTRQDYRYNWQTTWYNKDGGISDGKILMWGNDFDYTDNFVLLSDDAAPVYYDFSYIYENNWNVYLGKSFIVVQWRQGGNGYARVYDHSGNMTQDLSFGACQWISSDDFVGDIGVIRFTGYGNSKRVFITKDKYYEYDLALSPYDHLTLFNDWTWLNVHLYD